VTPHHCRHCGKLLRNRIERQAHLVERETGMGCTTLEPTPVLSRDQAARAERHQRLSFDLQKMRERLRVLIR
jgi:hypothetical protein